MPDANLERAIPDAAMAIFFNSGQTCFAGSRLLCHEDIYDQVIEGIAQVAQSLPVGDGSRPDTMIGPVINTKQRDRILEYIEIGQQQGARLITGGQTSAKQGYFVEPTILADVTAESRVFNEEIFGPVLAVTKFSNEEEAINLANKSVYGLGANIYSANVNTCHRMAAKINAGTVWLNTYFVVEPAMSFGGFKQSGLGREMGEDGILMYTESKSVCLRLDD
jgi:p-cumic aldehyde dehydrogenase